jgi:hypothetical protein
MYCSFSIRMDIILKITHRSSTRAFLFNFLKNISYAIYVHVTVHRDSFLVIKPTKCINFSNLFWNETLHISDSSSVHYQKLFTVYSEMVYVIQVCRQLSSEPARKLATNLYFHFCYVGFYIILPPIFMSS